MNTQFKKGVLEMCVLAVVNQNDIYGYELVQTIAENIEISEGTIYPLLRRLTNDGYFDTYLQESSAGPPRKYYRITQKGKDDLQSMKEEWDLFAASVLKLLNSVELKPIIDQNTEET